MWLLVRCWTLCSLRLRDKPHRGYSNAFDSNRRTPGHTIDRRTDVVDATMPETNIHAAAVFVFRAVRA